MILNRIGLNLMALALMSGALTQTSGTEAPPEQREPILPPYFPPPKREPPHTPEQIKAQAKRERKAKRYAKEQGK